MIHPAFSGLKSIVLAGVASLSLLAPVQALAQTAATPAVATPGTYAPAGSGAALWVVRDEDSTLYLFGTFHALRSDIAWRTERVDRAFASADDYWFEIADLNDMSEAIPIIQAKGVSPDRPLSSLLTPSEMESLDKAARSVGMSSTQLNPLRPWMVSLNLAVATITQAGFEPANGGDQVLHALAAATGKPIKGFETAGQQVSMLADMDEAVQLQVLRLSLKEFDKGTELLNQMVQAWGSGDVAALDQLTSEESRSAAPEMYEAIFTRRNQDWARQIQTLMAGSGTHFIAVGAGHLAGPDSLQVQLEKMGIRSERLTD